MSSPILRVCAATAACLALVVPGQVAAAPPTPKPSPFGKPKPQVKPGKVSAPGNAAAFARRLSGNRPELEIDSILGRQLESQAPRKKGSLAAFGSAKVELAPGVTDKLTAVGARAFGVHESMAKQLRGLKGKGVYGSVRTSTEVYEFKHSYVLVRSTGATVADAAKVRAKSPMFLRVASTKKATVQRSKLSSESKAGLASFKSEVAKYPSSHPLRKAMAKGEQALLDALANGIGDVEVVDTLQIPKKAPRTTPSGMKVPKVIGGQKMFGKTKNLPGTKPLSGNFTITNQDAADQLGAAVGAAAAGSSGGGGFQQTAEFVAGNTWSESWQWQRRWNVPSGFLRITLGASYAVGLRIPIELKTEMTPAWVCDDGLKSEGRDSSFRLKVKARAIDGNPAFYRRAGMPEKSIADGDELALQASVGYGVKLRLFWDTLVDRPYRETGVDWGSDFDPPQGSANERVTDIFLPADVTRTKFSFGPLSGSARLGLRVDVKGKVDARITARQGNKSLVASQRPSSSSAVSGPATSTPQKLTLASEGWKSYRFKLRNGTPNSSGSVPNYTQPFGFRVDQVGYDSDWSVVPGVKVRAKASYAGYGINGTWTFWLEGARLPIGSLDLGPHKGTRTKHDNFRGRKIWHRDTPGDTNWCADNNDTV